MPASQQLNKIPHYLGIILSDVIFTSSNGSLRYFWNLAALWAKIPPFSKGLWKRCRPRASKTAQGSEARGQFGGPRTPLFYSPEEKGGILTLLTGLYHFSLTLLSNESDGQMTRKPWHSGFRMPPVQKPWHSGKQYSQNAMVSKQGAF